MIGYMFVRQQITEFFNCCLTLRESAVVAVKVELVYVNIKGVAMVRCGDVLIRPAT